MGPMPCVDTEKKGRTAATKKKMYVETLLSRSFSSNKKKSKNMLRSRSISLVPRQVEEINILEVRFRMHKSVPRRRFRIDSQFVQTADHVRGNHLERLL